MPPQATQQPPAPGQYFDTPGVGGGTQWTDQFENTQSLATSMAQGAQVPVNGILAFKQTDVVIDWQLESAFTLAWAAGGGALTASAYAPWNLLGPVKLQVQNQYASVDVENGIDLYIFNMIRPWRKPHAQSFNVGYANPHGFPIGGTATGFVAAANAQPNLFNLTPSGQFTTATTAWRELLRLPASISFDLYYDLSIDGQPLAMPHPAIVSPQYMAGSTRQIVPSVVLNQGLGNADVSAVNGAGGAPTFTGSQSLTFRRKAVYSANPALMPPIYAWQYRWRTVRFGIPGRSTTQLQLPLDTGQLLSVYCRLFDPSAAGGVGAPIALSSVSSIQLQYGSGLLSFIGTPAELQADFMEKHGCLLPPGVFCIDLMLDERGNRSNRRALNTLTTAGILVQIDFTAPTSATAYCTMGTESLVFVA